jgi:hypothetical protein
MCSFVPCEYGDGPYWTALNGLNETHMGSSPASASFLLTSNDFAIKPETCFVQIGIYSLLTCRQGQELGDARHKPLLS